MKDFMEIISWNGLPCLINDKKAVIFSYVDNKLVCSEVEKSSLSSHELYISASENRLFECVHKSNIQEDLPIKQVTLCLTEKCNCKCKYCFLDANTKGQVMSKSTIEHAIDYSFSIFRGHTIVLSAFGGEPGTREDLIRYLVEYANSKSREYDTRIIFAITTNGVISDSLLDFLIQNKFICTISADGVKHVQDYQRPMSNGSGTYDRVVHTIKKLVDNGVEVKIRSTVTRYSLPYMLDSVREFGALGVSQIHFEPVTIAGRAMSVDEDLQQPSPEEYAEQILLCIKEANLYHTKINFSFCSRCSGTMKNKLIFGSNGLISSCVEVQSDKHEFANLFTMGQLYEDGTVLIERSELSSKTASIVDDDCQKCPYKIFCNNSCPIRNYRATGNYHITEPFKCKMFKYILPHILLNMYENTYC